MPSEDVLTRLLITVMTYPHPSRKSRELVCTAGITAEGDWVRLYPVNYRYRPVGQRFHKYQWVEVPLAPRASASDNRLESRRPDLDRLRILGPPLPAWEPRCEIVDRLTEHTVTELRRLYEDRRVSLGVVRPVQILDVKVENSRAEWKPGQQQALAQMTLFSDQPKRLEKLPYRFKYVFTCADSKAPHKAMIEDWELGVLFLKMRDKLGSETLAADCVKRKYLNEMCAPGRDTRFFMGTTFPYNSWVVIGVFWPPKQPQIRLELY